ncbi:MAG: DUF4349 domain-containing protein [Desulfitobacteriia bacterium]
MKDDKITAMWEEDGDLMRLKDFFTYVYQGNELKERIKNKTKEIIATDEENSSLEDMLPPAKSTTPARDTEFKNKKRLFLLSQLKDKIKEKKNIFKVLASAAVLVIAVYFGSGLMNGQAPSLLVGSAGSADKAKTEEVAFDSGAAPAAQSPQVAPNYSISMAKEAGGYLDAPSGSGERQLEARATNTVAGDSIEQKIIYVLEATIRSNDVAKTVQAVENTVTTLGGYIAESRENNERDHTTAYLSLKIPVSKFEEFKGGLEQFGTVSDQHLYTDDVSQQYFDVETRLRSWEAQEERYLEILKQAKTVEEILKIEDSLANVRREMESLKGQLKYWDHRVDYSEIRLHIYPTQSNIAVNDPWQPVSLKNTFIAAKNALIKSVSFLWNSVNYLLVFIGYAIPLSIILGLFYLIFRRLRKSRQKS